MSKFFLVTKTVCLTLNAFNCHCIKTAKSHATPFQLYIHAHANIHTILYLSYLWSSSFICVFIFFLFFFISNYVHYLMNDYAN